MTERVNHESFLFFVYVERRSVQRVIP